MSYYSDASAHFRYLGSPRPSWRPPQFGALGAIAMHWSLSPFEPALVSIPTGSGKTAIAMAAPFFANKPIRRVLALVPTRALREQIATSFRTGDLLRRIGALPEDFEAKPAVVELSGRPKSWAELLAADVVVALPNSISPMHFDEAAQPPRDLFDLVVVDEAHHSPAPTWQAVLDHFSEAHALLLTATPVRRDGKRLPGRQVYYYPLRRALDERFYKPVTPMILTVDAAGDRAEADRAIAEACVRLLQQDDTRRAP